LYNLNIEFFNINLDKSKEAKNERSLRFVNKQITRRQSNERKGTLVLRRCKMKKGGKSKHGGMSKNGPVCKRKERDPW